MIKRAACLTTPVIKLRADVRSHPLVLARLRLQTTIDESVPNLQMQPNASCAPWIVRLPPSLRAEQIETPSTQ